MALSAKQLADRSDWEVDDDLRTLARAEEIKSDKKRYAQAVKRANEKISELRDVVADASEDAAEEAAEAAGK